MTFGLVLKRNERIREIGAEEVFDFDLRSIQLENPFGLHGNISW